LPEGAVIYADKAYTERGIELKAFLAVLAFSFACLATC
jgi:hypothetical protein